MAKTAKASRASEAPLHAVSLEHAVVVSPSYYLDITLVVRCVALVSEILNPKP